MSNRGDSKNSRVKAILTVFALIALVMVWRLGSKVFDGANDSRMKSELSMIGSVQKAYKEEAGKYLTSADEMSRLGGYKPNAAIGTRSFYSEADLPVEWKPRLDASFIPFVSITAYRIVSCTGSTSAAQPNCMAVDQTGTIKKVEFK